jgi:hypothetical protein
MKLPVTSASSHHMTASHLRRPGPDRTAPRAVGSRRRLRAAQRRRLLLLLLLLHKLHNHSTRMCTSPPPSPLHPTMDGNPPLPPSHAPPAGRRAAQHQSGVPWRPSHPESRSRRASARPNPGQTSPPAQHQTSLPGVDQCPPTRSAWACSEEQEQGLRYRLRSKSRVFGIEQGRAVEQEKQGCAPAPHEDAAPDAAGGAELDAWCRLRTRAECPGSMIGWWSMSSAASSRHARRAVYERRLR